jgi:hypothetical protein
MWTVNELEILILLLGTMKVTNGLKAFMKNLQLPLAKRLLPLVSMAMMVKEN